MKPVNDEGVPHVDTSKLPSGEAAELNALLGGMRAKNTDHAAQEVFNPIGHATAKRFAQKLVEHETESLAEDKAEGEEE